MSYFISSIMPFFNKDLEDNLEDNFEDNFGFSEDEILDERCSNEGVINVGIKEQAESKSKSKLIGEALTFYQIENSIGNLKYHFGCEQAALIEFSGVDNLLINPSYDLFANIDISKSYLIMVSYTHSNSFIDSISFCDGHSILLKVDSEIEIIDPKGPFFSVSKEFINKVFNNINISEIKGNAEYVLSDIKKKSEKMSYISWDDFNLYVNSEGRQPIFFNNTCSRRCIMMINNILNPDKQIILDDIDKIITGDISTNLDAVNLFYNSKSSKDKELSPGVDL